LNTQNKLIFNFYLLIIVKFRNHLKNEAHPKGHKSRNTKQTRMKLFITRDQDQGLMGGISFVLKCKVELNAGEMDIIKKYKAHKETLVIKTLTLFGRSLNLAITIGDLIDGQKFKCKDIGEILAYEDNVKEACGKFKEYVEIMRQFGGEEIVDFS
jgi:hypothetical protein